MDYKFVQPENKLEGVQNRIAQLEAEHYSSEIYIIEATAVGDEQAVKDLRSKQEGIEIQIGSLETLLEKLNKEIKPADSTKGEH